ncbi:hypothetical protein CEXT_94151 [Caerostris extrusa]|uniref:Uncharacterized protein n=1 Tax=Caerostris extrusa TaxID=172846 RepID=A0AAV4VVL9_CAEEX|nr:hypothetical protein CEXT_94151 [Caerostris extrusa]
MQKQVFYCKSKQSRYCIGFPSNNCGDEYIKFMPSPDVFKRANLHSCEGAWLLVWRCVSFQNCGIRKTSGNLTSKIINLSANMRQSEAYSRKHVCYRVSGFQLQYCRRCFSRGSESLLSWVPFRIVPSI